MDISNAIPQNSDYTIKGTDDYSEISESDIIIVAASTGVYLKNRNEMIGSQAVMIKQIGKKIKEHCKSPITLVVSNPVDVLTYFFQKETKFPREKVIGIASSLDSSRFRFLLSKHLKVKKSQISDTIVMGEHGDSMIPIFSKAKINEKSALEMIEPKTKEKISVEIRDYWKALRNFKSRSQFGIAKNTFDAIKSIIYNQEISVPASILLNGEYGENDVCMGVPVSITRDGVSEIQEIALEKSELESLKKSASKIRDNINSI